MNNPTGTSRSQVAVLYLVLTTAIASGIVIYSSASTITELLKTATTGLFLPLLLSLIVSFLLDPMVQFFEVKKNQSYRQYFYCIPASIYHHPPVVLNCWST